MPNHRSCSSVAAFGVGIFCLPMMIFGQATYQGSIGGVVSDPSGAVIPAATVTVTETSTNISHTVKTGPGGKYWIPGLRPSTYTLKVQAQGFRPEERKNVVLQ